MGEAGSIAETFEFLLAEWHLPPDYIADNWTDEMLQLMLGKLVERKERLNEALSRVSQGLDTEGSDRVVSDAALFNMLGLKVERHGDFS